MKKEEKKKPLTIEERIENLNNQGLQAQQQVSKFQEIAIKCQGAIEVLQGMLNEEKEQVAD